MSETQTLWTEQIEFPARTSIVLPEIIYKNK